LDGDIFCIQEIKAPGKARWNSTAGAIPNTGTMLEKIGYSRFGGVFKGMPLSASVGLGIPEHDTKAGP
jgi:hypothetical protein